MFLTFLHILQTLISRLETNMEEIQKTRKRLIVRTCTYDKVFSTKNSFSPKQKCLPNFSFFYGAFRMYASLFFFSCRLRFTTLDVVVIFLTNFYNPKQPFKLFLTKMRVVNFLFTYFKTFCCKHRICTSITYRERSFRKGTQGQLVLT